MTKSLLPAPPDYGEVHPLRERLAWLRLPLPFALDHVNVWLLDDGDGWTVIDTGVGDARCRAIWDAVLDGPLGGKPVRRVIATHFHPDHVGLFGGLLARTGAEPCMSRTDWLTARSLSLDDTEAFAQAGAAYDRAAGLDAGAIAERQARGNLYRKGVTPVPARVNRLEDGDEIAMGGTTWRVRVGRGHAPEMLTFFSPEHNLLIAADQVLPRISPVVGLWPTTSEKDPLGDFLTSLDAYRDLPEDVLVLPSHDGPFRGLHARIDALQAHHRARLDTCLQAAAEPVTAVGVMPRLFARRLDAAQIGFALAETMAHLNHLHRQGMLATETGPDGAVLWRRR